MLKIFVTGDNHIGKKYSDHPKKEKIISERIEALTRMVKEANREKCGLFAVTGDLFDRVNNIAKKDIKAVVSALSEFEGSVAVIPGNHDYYEKNSELWEEFKLNAQEYGSIILMTEYKPYEFDMGAVIYPAFCDKKHSDPGENRLDWIKKLSFDSGKYHIGMAHGTVEGESPGSEGKYFVMTREELYKIPVDLWLIGHTHVPFPLLSEEFSGTREKIFNAGTHVQTDVSNNAEGQCFILEIDNEKNVRAKKFISGDLRFYRIDVDVTAGNMERVLNEKLKDCGDNSVVEIILRGTASEEEYNDRAEIIANAAGRFLEFKGYSDSALSMLITKERIEKEFAENSFAAGLLTELLADPKETQLLYDLITGKNKEDRK